MKHEQTLKHYQLKATPQRIAILQLMYDAGHINIDELYSSIRQKFTSISLATLYKNIHTMMDVTLIREVKIAGQKIKYELEKESHAHILCKGCGELKDIPLDPMNILKKSIDVTRYQVEDVSIIISGLCLECQK